MIPFAPIIAEKAKAVRRSFDRRLLLSYLKFILTNPANLEAIQAWTWSIVVVECFDIAFTAITDEHEAEMCCARRELRVHLDYASIASRQEIGRRQKDKGTCVSRISG